MATRNWRYLILSLTVGLVVWGILLTLALPARADVPGPLPDECGGVNPPGDPIPVCCLYGYIYKDGIPAVDMQVVVQSVHGTFPVVTSRVTGSIYPYYRLDLSAVPLSVTAGSLITITVQDGENQRQIVHRVTPGAQQVDVVLPRTATWASPYNFSDNPDSSTRANMVIDAEGTLYMVWKEDTGGNHIAYASRPWGSGWSTPITIPNSGGFVDGHSSLAIDQNGGLHVVMTNDNAIHYAHKPQGGAWLTTTTVYSSPNGVERPSVTVDGLRTVHVAWHNWENGELWYVSKPDGGAWGTPAAIIDRSDEVWSPSMVADRDNTVHLVYHAGVYPYFEVYYIAKPEGGDWSSPVNVSNTAPGSWYPDMVLDADDGLHVVWHEHPMDDGGDLYYAYKPHGGGWTAATPVYDTAGGSHHPRLAVDAEYKTLHLVWQEDDTEIFYSTKPWGGVWSAPLNLSNSAASPSMQPAIATDGTRLHVVWEERLASEEIYYTEKILTFGPVATINAITPSSATQGLDTVYFNGSGQDADEGGAAIVAHRWESGRDGVLSTLPVFSLQATQLSSGTHTITFTVQDDEGEWSPVVTRTLTVLPTMSDVHTLILVNEPRMTALYSETVVAQMMDRLDALAVHPSVRGMVMPVNQDAVATAAYDAWDTDPTSAVKANAVTDALHDLILAEWGAYPNLSYLVIVGDDRVIPFRRIPDRTGYPEHHYPWVSPTSTVGAALRADMTLTDDYLGDAIPLILPDGRPFYIPDLATGRLVETPDEIIAQIAAFLENDTLVADSAIVTGYDFLKDGAQATCVTLTADGLVTDCELINDMWRRVDFIARVLNTFHALISLNGHANHYSFSAPLGEAITAIDVAAASLDHARVLVFTIGCHAGLNVPPDNPYQPYDWPQAIAYLRGVYVANTGYGWGYRASVGLSEQLMLNFTEALVYGQSATPGLALVRAKQAYYLAEADFDVNDEKIMLESTLYGLPMYGYQTPTGGGAVRQSQAQAAPSVLSTAVTTTSLGLTVQSVTWDFPAPIAETSDEGTVYAFGDDFYLSDGKPKQPIHVYDMYFPDTQPHGVILRSAVYTDVVGYDPVIEQAITETVPLSESTFSAPGLYPAIPFAFNHLDGDGTLVIFLGQYRAANQTERLYDEFSFDFTYHDDSDDWQPPELTAMQSALATDSVTITVRASDAAQNIPHSANGIHAVVVAYTDDSGVWESVALTETGETWSGSWPGSAATAFFVQVVDKAGNVTVVDKDGVYFQPGDSVVPQVVYLPLVMR